VLDIGEVARRSGLAASALRFYERKGLIAAAARNGLRRAYTPRRAGPARADHRRPQRGLHPGRARRAARCQASELDHRITQLAAIRDSLRPAVASQHDPVTGCPLFLDAIRPATPTLRKPRSNDLAPTSRAR